MPHVGQQQTNSFPKDLSQFGVLLSQIIDCMTRTTLM